jgi:hypothetical protein
MRCLPTLLSLASTAAALAGAGCGSAPPPGARSGASRELVIGYDDARATGTMAFPSNTYESVVRFELPGGEHRPLRLLLQAEAAGTLEITFYESTPLETPGGVIRTVSRDLAKEDLSDGKDGRWVVEELGDMKPMKGVVWVGVRKRGGEPTIWASSVSSGQAFIRNTDPQNLMSLLPTRNTPMIRLEVAP